MTPAWYYVLAAACLVLLGAAALAASHQSSAHAPPDPLRWVPRTAGFGDEHLAYDRDGIRWYDAPFPDVWHECQAWTYETWQKDRTEIVHCACGAVKAGSGPWHGKNTRTRQ